MKQTWIPVEVWGVGVFGAVYTLRMWGLAETGAISDASILLTAPR